MIRRVLTVDEFCTAHAMTRGLFYKLRSQGQAPETIKIGRKTLITEEAAATWLRSLSAQAQAPQGGAA